MRTSFQRSIAGNDVDAVAAAALEQVGHRVVEVGELVAQRTEAVDDQHDVGGGQPWQPSLGAQVAQLVDGVDAVLAEQLLADRQHAAHLGDRAGGPLVVGAGGDAADVR